MRKLILCLLAGMASTFLFAQQDTTRPKQDTALQQYTGKYTFPEGSPVSEIAVVLENGVLTARSVMGNSELKKSDGDVFEVVAYGGLAIFKRGNEGRVNGVRIEVNDLIMEGTKSETQVSSSMAINPPNRERYTLSR